jgi:hypothetical protein
MVASLKNLRLDSIKKKEHILQVATIQYTCLGLYTMPVSTGCLIRRTRRQTGDLGWWPEIFSLRAQDTTCAAAARSLAGSYTLRWKVIIARKPLVSLRRRAKEQKRALSSPPSYRRSCHGEETTAGAGFPSRPPFGRWSGRQSNQGQRS